MKRRRGRRRRRGRTTLKGTKDATAEAAEAAASVEPDAVVTRWPRPPAGCSGKNESSFKCHFLLQQYRFKALK